MKKVLSMILTAAMVLALFSGSAFAGSGNGNNSSHKDKMKDFKDMKGHWGYQSVQKMQSYGIFGGYSDGTFRPDNVLTEAELAVIIDRLLEARQNNDDDTDEDQILWDDKDFNDVPAWARASVWKGFHKHYFNMNRFHSQVQVDRLTAFVAIAKALDLEPVTDFSYNPFKDRGLISDEDYGYLLALYKEGYINGFPGGYLNPYSYLSRAQMASIIEKLLDELEDQNEDSDDDNAPTWDNDSTVTATAVHSGSVDLKWSAAEDDVRVVGYKVLYEVDGVDKVKSVTGRTATITGLDSDEEYTFTVEAKDAGGNWSDDGPSVDVTTLEEDDEDTQEPSWDNDSIVTATAIRTNSVDLKWSAAEDDVKVVGYKVLYEVNGVDKVKTVAGRTVTITGLDADEEYTFTIEAKDAEGNWSDDGPSVDVTTLEEEDDTTNPTWPEGAKLTISDSASGVVTIVWPDAHDNVGVESYKLYQDGDLIKTLDGDDNSVNVNGLDSDTEYVFKLKAIDKEGNQSIGLTKTYVTD